MASWLGEHTFTRPRSPVAPPEAKAGVTLPPEFFWDANGDPIGGATPGHIRLWTAYRAYTLAYACMLYRATKMAEAPVWIVDETADGDEWLEGEHVLSDVLTEPNLDMDMPDLLELVSLYLDTAGLTVLHKTRDRSGRVARLYPYHRDEVRIEAADGRLYGRFTLQTDRGPLIVPASEVVLLRTTNPSDLRTGLGPLDVALAHVNIGNDLRRAVTAMLRNAIRPSAKVETATAFQTQDDFDRFRERLTSGNAGVDKTGKLVIVEGAKLDLLPSGMKDVDMGPVQGDVEAAICQVFQVHPALAMAKIGIESNSGFADTLEPATDLFYDVVAVPRWRRIERALTRQLLREADDTPDRRIKFDTSNIRALQDDLGDRTSEATAAAGYWTVNEARVHTGQAPLPDDDERGDEFVKAPKAVTVTGEPDQSGDTPPAKGRKDAFSRRDATRLIESATRETEETMLELMARHQLQLDEVAVHQAIGLHQKADHERPVSASEAADLTKKAEQAIDHGVDRWHEAMTEPLQGIAKRSVERLSTHLGVRFDLLQPGLLDFVKREAAELVTHVSDTTKDALKRAISDSLEEGDGIRGMAQRIRDTGAFSKPRANLIAVTETTRTRNGASLESMQRYAKDTPGLVSTKEWLNSGDSKVRTEHQDAPVGVGRERVPVDQPFSNGLLAPGEPNCRCSLLYDVDVEA